MTKDISAFEVTKLVDPIVSTELNVTNVVCELSTVEAREVSVNDDSKVEKGHQVV